MDGAFRTAQCVYVCVTDLSFSSEILGGGALGECAAPGRLLSVQSPMEPLLCGPERHTSSSTHTQGKSRESTERGNTKRCVTSLDAGGKFVSSSNAVFCVL